MRIELPQASKNPVANNAERRDFIDLSPILNELSRYWWRGKKLQI